MWLVYLIQLLDNVTCVCGVLSVFLGIALLISFVLETSARVEMGRSFGIYKESDYLGFKKLRKWSLGLFIPCIMIATFVPSSKQAVQILTVGSTIEYVKGNDKLKELPDKMVDCLDKFIDDYLNEDNEDNEQESGK